jgi:hypothetical protein
MVVVNGGKGLGLNVQDAEDVFCKWVTKHIRILLHHMQQFRFVIVIVITIHVCHINCSSRALTLYGKTINGIIKELAVNLGYK